VFSHPGSLMIHASDRPLSTLPSQFGQSSMKEAVQAVQ